jgi:hypothetical protein
LLAYEEALAAGSPPDAGPTSGAEVDPVVQERFEQAKAFLQLMRCVWPRSEEQTPDRPPTQPGLRPADPVGVEAGGPAPLPRPSLTHLGRFEIRKELGRGGFGVVFLAHDPILGRLVALKVPRPEAVLTPHLRARFLREARAAAGLNHPNLVPVYEAGEEGPVCYLTSEYCPGPTLATWLAAQKAPVPFAMAASVVLSLADAVGHAHGRGVLHRDLKPANVLLAPVEGLVPLTPGQGDTIALPNPAPRPGDGGVRPGGDDHVAVPIQAGGGVPAAEGRRMVGAAE